MHVEKLLDRTDTLAREALVILHNEFDFPAIYPPASLTSAKTAAKLTPAE